MTTPKYYGRQYDVVCTGIFQDDGATPITLTAGVPAYNEDLDCAEFTPPVVTIPNIGENLGKIADRPVEGKPSIGPFRLVFNRAYPDLNRMGQAVRYEVTEHDLSRTGASGETEWTVRGRQLAGPEVTLNRDGSIRTWTINYETEQMTRTFTPDATSQGTGVKTEDRVDLLSNPPVFESHGFNYVTTL